MNHLQRGQSLIELIIALGLSVFIIATVVGGIAGLLRGGKESQYTQTAAGLAQEMLANLSAVAEHDWHDVYNLTKDTQTYYVNASGAAFRIVKGKESVLGDTISDGLIDHWKFDEVPLQTDADVNVVYDATVNNHNGCLGGFNQGQQSCTSGNGQQPTRNLSCKAGPCLTFDGSNDYVEIFDSFNPTAYTIAAWVRPLAYNSNIIVRTSNRGARADWSHQLKYNEYGFFEHYTFDGVSKHVVGTTPVQNSQWYFVVGTAQNNDMMHLYVNGKEEGTPVPITTLWSGGDRYQIGVDTSNAFSFLKVRNFPGDIDDVRVYNRALTAKEIWQLYNSVVYTRSFTIKNVNRDYCGTSSVTGNPSTGCLSTQGALSSDVANDPSTQQIQTTLEWSPQNVLRSFTNAAYLTRNKNSVFWQSDWSGGPPGNATTLATSTETKFFSSSNINYSQQGKITVQGVPDF